MNNLLLILLLYLGRRITARFINPKEAEVSKVDYQLNVDSSDVRGVATIFDTCLNLGHLFLTVFHTRSNKSRLSTDESFKS